MKTGKLPESILKRSVLGKIKNRRNEVLKGAGVGNDCAFLALESENGKGTGQGEKTAKAGKELAAIMAVSTETVNLPVKNAAYLAVMAAANNVAAGGGRPVSVMLSVTLPVETEEAQLRELMGEAERCCMELGVQIAGGHTEVSSYVRCPVITATAIGDTEKQMPVIYREMEGSHKFDIVMSKWIGLEGTCILAGEKEKELLTRYPVRLVSEAKAQEKFLSVALEAEIALKQGAYVMHDFFKARRVQYLRQCGRRAADGGHLERPDHDWRVLLYEGYYSGRCTDFCSWFCGGDQQGQAVSLACGRGTTGGERRKEDRDESIWHLRMVAPGGRAVWGPAGGGMWV